MKDATLLRGVEGCHAAPWWSSVASSNTTEQRGILQHHGAAWHPSSPRSTVASFNTGCSMVLKDATLLVVLKDATLLRGVEGCHAAPWC
jgi:hypothetical protein